MDFAELPVFKGLLTTPNGERGSNPVAGADATRYLQSSRSSTGLFVGVQVFPGKQPPRYQ